ncbi:hypothetical protein Rhe02_98240 [Rhizocola hellebori]|uniref:DUF4245 domain-containing protein n=1 Tax=Rhizocola hellebori TaxID=1392758 RepID=A0A8J3VMJ9_9ACTN|nr:DUF4245 family protein [Rhizocola hellebori]GIH11757.1 hypothetical protein Rhe02_98240 [Rhizocola hellebori]
MTVTSEKKTRTPRDLALSLIVLLVPVFLIVLGYRYLYGGDTIVTVDPAEAIASAQRAGMSQLPPNTAPEGWLVVHAQFRDGALRIGYLTKDHEGVQLVQSRADLSSTVQAKPGETRLLGRSGDITVVVVAAQGADASPLARLLPIPVQASASQ